MSLRDPKTPAEARKALLWLIHDASRTIASLRRAGRFDCVGALEDWRRSAFALLRGEPDVSWRNALATIERDHNAAPRLAFLCCYLLQRINQGDLE